MVLGSAEEHRLTHWSPPSICAKVTNTQLFRFTALLCYTLGLLLLTFVLAGICSAGVQLMALYALSWAQGRKKFFVLSCCLIYSHFH
jgi:hypothetical protein